MGKKHKRMNRRTDVHDEETIKKRREGELMLMDRREIVGRILDTAILLWFAERDPVSTHILACIAHQNLDALGTKKGIGCPTLKETVKWEDIYSAYNDFRHCNGDPDHRDQFAPDNNKELIIDSVNSFRMIFEFHSPWMMTFAFFQTRNEPEITAHLSSMFPNVRIHDVAKLPMREFAQTMHPVFVSAYEQGLR
jgi:hypothetical protein